VWLTLEAPDCLLFEAAGMRMSDVLIVHFVTRPIGIYGDDAPSRREAPKDMMREAMATVDAQRALVEPHPGGRSH
jgi:hypothetical protein